MNIKLERLNATFVEKISEILHDKIEDKNVKLVTITDAQITRDLSLAKIYFVVKEDKIKTLKSLNKASKFIRSELCKRIQLRKMPEIRFIYDESWDYGNKIDKIIERISNERKD